MGKGYSDQDYVYVNVVYLSVCLFFKPGVSNFTDLRTKFGIADVVSCSQILNLSADFKRTTALKKTKQNKKKTRVVTL